MRALRVVARPRLPVRRVSVGGARLGDHFFAGDGSLRADPAPLDHFALLGVAAGLDVDGAALDAGLRALQHRLHPDRFAGAADDQRARAEAASARVNDALSVLRDPLSRYDYLLSLSTGALVLDDETRTAPPALLVAVMESREAVDDAADADALEAVLEANDAAAAAATAGLRDAVARRDVDDAADRIVELNFYGKVLAEARAAADARGWRLDRDPPL